MSSLLFYGASDLREYLKKRRANLQAEVDDCDPDYLLKVSEADFRDYLIAKYSVNPPKILTDRIYQHEPKDVDIDVSRDPLRAVRDRSRPAHIRGTAIIISLPFEGEAELFRYQPSTFTFNPPRGEIVGQEVRLTYEFTTPDPKSLKARFDRDLESIQEYLQWVERDVVSLNRSLHQEAGQAISRRKNKLLADRSMTAALGIPIKRRQDAPRTYTVPNVRRKPIIQRPSVSTTEPFQPEPALADSEYESILQIIQNMVTVMERSPRAFVDMNEEDLRQHFLVQLNGQYEGQATGETFNFSGKTDILIRVEGKNIFIAECKFWRGPTALAETIDQLLGYTSWRDTKTAVLLFSRNKNFGNVLASIPGAVKEHPCFKREIGITGETIFRYVFHQRNDPNRELLLTILVFDIPRKD